MIMGSYSGVALVLFSIWIMKFIAQGTFSVEDLTVPACRIAGVALISRPKKLNFSEAAHACNQLGLQLAKRTQVKKAWSHGFETCSYGWVADKWTVISRQSPNPKCGQNKTGVVDWNVSLNRGSSGYCFNSSAGYYSDNFIVSIDVRVPATMNDQFLLRATFSLQTYPELQSSTYNFKDTWINSCISEANSTLIPSTVTEINSSSAVSSQGITKMPKTTELPKIKKPHMVCVMETILTTMQTTVESQEEMALPNGNHAAFRNDNVVFGDVPTALLVLALFFFIAFVVLATCYIKKYNDTCPFSNKNQQQEMIETKVIKEATSSDKVPEKEPKNNGKKAEELQTKPEATVKCVEAEV